MNDKFNYQNLFLENEKFFEISKSRQFFILEN